MPSLPRVVLKSGKDTPILAGHPWVFSEALSYCDKTEPGALVSIFDQREKHLGTGYINPLTSIRVRVLTLDPAEAIDVDFFSRRFSRLDAWKRANLPAETNGYRLVHAEADCLPGLIIDRFHDVFVFQLHTAGMDGMRDLIIEALRVTFSPKAIVERSDLDVRRMEGLRTQPVGVCYGELDEETTFVENGHTFIADVLKGQKTGFFLDQRDTRAAVGRYAKGKSVLNLFGYTGAFSVYAAKAGASYVSTIDVSHRALEVAMRHIALNGMDPEDESRFAFVEADVLELLEDRKSLDHEPDIIICDPPAFAKSERHMPQAMKAYTDVNTACLSRLQVGGVLVTSSCSGRVTPEDFRSMLRIAAGRAGRDVRVREWITQPVDHAERLAFPEGRYLKTAILEVTGVKER